MVIAVCTTHDHDLVCHRLVHSKLLIGFRGRIVADVVLIVDVHPRFPHAPLVSYAEHIALEHLAESALDNTIAVYLAATTASGLDDTP
jgi:hypothetical protein